MLCNPALAAFAIYDGVKAEESSRILEDLLFLNVGHYNPSEKDLETLSKAMAKKPVYIGTGYQHEVEVNSRLGLSYTDIFRKIARN